MANDKSLAAKVAEVAADTLFALGHKAAEFSRKRGVNDEEHWFPKHYTQLGLLAHQCYHCEEILPNEPKRGCRGRPR